MKVPFTLAQFMEVFRNYNTAVWPMQIIFYLLAITAIFLVFRKNSNLMISGILSFFWLWMGIVYHIIYFSSINKAAFAFGSMFIIQGMLFLFYGVIRQQLVFEYKGRNGLIGALLILYALVIYPALGYAMGHVYPESPSFGLPCPTTIFSFGLLLWTNKRFPFGLLIIPLVWSVIGMSASMKFGMKEDIGLLIAGLLTAMLLIRRNRASNKIVTA